MTWREDRETLRNYIREHKPEGEVATTLYVLVSHMRGKIHMKYCNSFGAYKNCRYKSKSVLPKPTGKLARAYQGSLDYYHQRIYIGSLEDQENWFSEVGHKSLRFLPPEVDEITDRIFLGYPQEKDLPELAVAV